MIGKRLKELRESRTLSLTELARRVNRHISTISRYESDKVERWDPELVEILAKELGTSSAYLLGMTDEVGLSFDYDINEYVKEDIYTTVIVSDDGMSPEIPYGAILKIRPVDPSEKLQIGSYYYIEFNDKKCFRMAVEDHIDGVGFLPHHASERRIAYDREYVKIIGKAVEMKVSFDDVVEYA